MYLKCGMMFLVCLLSYLASFHGYSGFVKMQTNYLIVSLLLLHIQYIIIKFVKLEMH